MRCLFVTPPMVQLNTPYPATAYLVGFLRQHAGRLGLELRQADASIELFTRLYSAPLVARMAAELQSRARASRRRTAMPPAIANFLAHAPRYVATVEPAIRFLQRRDPSLALRIVGRAFLPEGPRFAHLQASGQDGMDESLLAAFGLLGTTEQARHLASLYVDDLADVWREGIDPRFELARYGERLAASAPSFDPLHEALHAEPTLVDSTLDELTRELVGTHRPDLVAITAPFPGNVYGAFRMAREIRAVSPGTVLVLGGGWVNTELRSLREPRVFDWFDHITLDDGERPLLNIIERRAGAKVPLLRTWSRRDGAVVFDTDPTQHDVPQREAGIPTYEGLPLQRYVSLLEMTNPMHRFWSDGRWNKITLAHGCYWKKCSFCDVSLDYIGRYDRAATDLVMRRIRSMIEETGESGFHLVDEAAPPEAMDALARRLLDEQLSITWWGNIRFEKTFGPELCRRLASAGLVAVSGGLEVASDRLLELMQKGVTVRQVARVTRAFTDAGVMVHAYLMYGFPTETEQETIDALERVRQLFAAGCIQSAYWHRFSATVHSPVGRQPQRYGITLKPGPPVTFAQNDIAFEDPTGTDHDFLGTGLRTALYNYMHGAGLDRDVREWFGPRGGGRAAARGKRGRGVRHSVPATTVPPDLIERYLA